MSCLAKEYEQNFLNCLLLTSSNESVVVSESAHVMQHSIQVYLELKYHMCTLSILKAKAYTLNITEIFLQ